MSVSQNVRFVGIGICLMMGARTIAAQTYTIFDPPGSYYTYPLSINNAGAVAGYFFGPKADYDHAFVRDLYGNITVFDGPNALASWATSINDNGDVTGAFWDGTLNQAKNQSWYRGLIRHTDGTVEVFDGPNAIYTESRSINNAGSVTGEFMDQNYKIHGFFRDAAGNITAFDAPSTAYTVPWSINNNGEIAGYFWDLALNRYRGFVRTKDGDIVTFDPPGSSAAYVSNINNRGDIAGVFYDGTGIPSGFIRDHGGNITAFRVRGHLPNVDIFREYAIAAMNDAGTCTGGVWNSSQGFIRDQRGNLTGIDVSGAIGTSPLSINENGDVAGTFNYDAGRQHGFVRTAR